MKKRKAFTLLELMVVVVILGILVGIAVPTYTKAIRRADVKEAVANLRLIYQAQKAYYMKYGGYPAAMTVENTINQVLHLDLERNRWDYQTGNGPSELGRATYLKGPPNVIFKVNDNIGTEGEPYCDSGPFCDQF